MFLSTQLNTSDKKLKIGNTNLGWIIAKPPNNFKKSMKTLLDKKCKTRTQIKTDRKSDQTNIPEKWCMNYFLYCLHTTMKLLVTFYLLINYELFKQDCGGVIKLRMTTGPNIRYAQNKTRMQHFGWKPSKAHIVATYRLWEDSFRI
jgi:hypothetical protein